MTQLGSNWNNTTNAGSFYWNLNNTVSNRNRNIGSRTALLIKGYYNLTIDEFKPYLLVKNTLVN